MKKNNTICFGIILFCMMLLLFPSHSEAKKKTYKTFYNNTEYYYQYREKNKKEVEIVKIKKLSSTLVIPAYLDGKEVYGTCGVDSYDMMKTDSSYKKVKNVVIEKGVKERYDSDSNEYYNSTLKQVKIVVK